MFNFTAKRYTHMIMIRKSIAVAVALMATCSIAAAENAAQSPCNGADRLKVMSMNVRYDNPYDTPENSWPSRKDRVADAILFYTPDILGTQEVLHNQLIDLCSRLDATYCHTGVGREDGKEQGEYAALWWRRDRFDLNDSGNFWLSQTPDVDGSLGWDAACVRIASWAILTDRCSGRQIFALDTHLDHVGEVARAMSVNLLLQRIDSLSHGLPVVAMGDFNSTPDSEVVKGLTDSTRKYHLRDTRTTSPLVYGPTWSYHDFGKLPTDKRVLIDYIFIHGPLRAVSYGVMSENDFGDAYLSDHCPVIVNLELE